MTLVSHIFLLIFIAFSAYLVITAISPVDSVLFLILVFLNSAAYLILIEAEFIALIFLVIYVGAIAVLFLFIVMMLDIKIQREENSLFFQYGPIVIIFGGFFFFEIFISISDIFSKVPIITPVSSWHLLVDNLSNIDLLGQALYKDFLGCFLLAGMLLLVSMIGAIVLTIPFYSSRQNEIICRQISRSPSFHKFEKELEAAVLAFLEEEKRKLEKKEVFLAN